MRTNTARKPDIAATTQLPLRPQPPALAIDPAQPTSFQTILADPPWPEYGGGKRGAQHHYPLMSVADIVRLPVADAFCRGGAAHLWLWCTNNYLEAGLRALHAWGFRYVTNAVWVKGRVDADAGALRLQQGLGQYLRGSHELLLFGIRGNLPALRAVPSAILAPRGQHSAKPAAAYDLIEAVSPGPRVELFARAARPGWTAIGNQTSCDDIHTALERRLQVRLQEA